MEPLPKRSRTSLEPNPAVVGRRRGSCVIRFKTTSKEDFIKDVATWHKLLKQNFQGCWNNVKTEQKHRGGGCGVGWGSELSTLNLREGQHKTGAVLVLQTASKSPFSSPVMT